jgi:hypothetical protein
MLRSLRLCFVVRRTLAIAALLSSPLLPSAWLQAQHRPSSSQPFDTAQLVQGDDLVQRQGNVLIQSVMNKQKDEEQGVFSLVSKKDLVARFFYLTTDGKDRASTILLCVDAQVPKCPPDKLFKATGTVYSTKHDFTVAERRAAKNSLNVFITGDKANTLLTSGKHTFYAAVAVAEESLPDMVTGNFQDSTTLNIFVAPYKLNSLSPDKDLLTHAGDLVRAVYPINEENVTVTQVADADFDAGERKEFTAADFDKLKKVFKDRLLVNDKTVKDAYSKAPEANNIVLGVVTSAASNAPFGKSDGVSILGYTRGFQQAPRAAVTLDRTPKGDDTIKLPNLILLASTAAHEIGHLFGFGDEYPNGSSELVNPPHSKDQDLTGTAAGYYALEKEMAFDVSGVRKVLYKLDNPKLAAPDVSAVFVALSGNASPVPDPADPIAEGAIYGYMGGTGRAAVDKGLGALLEGGADVRSWTRELNYEYLYPKLKKPSDSPSQLLPSSRDVIRISGEIGQDDSSAFDIFLTANTDVAFTDPVGVEYSIQLRDPANQVLKEVFFDLSFTEHLILDGNTNIDRTQFETVIDFPSQTASVVLLHAGNVLNTYFVVPETPSLTINSAQISGDTLTVSWSASDPGPQEYIVLYLPDGVTPYAFATDIPSIREFDRLSAARTRRAGLRSRQQRIAQHREVHADFALAVDSDASNACRALPCLQQTL